MADVALVLALCAVAVPWLGAAILFRPALLQNRTRLALAAGIVDAILGWSVFVTSHVAGAGQPGALLGVDELAALLFPFATGIGLVALIVCPRRAHESGALRRLLIGQGLVLGMFICREPFALSAIWSALTLLAVLEIRAAAGEGGGTARVEIGYLGTSSLLFLAGAIAGRTSPGSSWGPALLLAAAFLRAGIVPFHSWVPGFFNRVAPGPAMAAMAPQIGAYALIVLVLPRARPELLQAAMVLPLFTTIYAAALGLVQREARRAISWLFLSLSAIVFAGFASGSPEGLSGGLILWISTGLAGAGLGFCLWVLEARRGRLDLNRWHGGYSRMPILAASVLLLGLALVGFPGTLGFVGQELVVEGSVASGPWPGFVILLATALNGITLLRLFFRLFCGTADRTPDEQRLVPRERIGLAILTAALIWGGLAPRTLVDSRAVEHARTHDAVPEPGN